ncbi:MAG: hypothetical protein AB8B99_13030 [Phormidesmis sp.]
MGLFEFVFGKGAPKDESAPKQAYYLSNDDAKSFGDIEYMRSSKTVKRTFAKKKGQTEHMESVRQISATAAAEIGATNNSYSQPSVTFSSVAASTPAPAPATPAAATQAPATEAPAAEAPAAEAVTPAPRRKASSGDMDMFRNMAKSIRK